MNSKNGRQNHNFQIVHFLIGSCHTPDAAYALMADQYEDRNNAINMYVGAAKREQAKIIRAKDKLKGMNVNEADKLEAEADLSDIEAMQETVQRNLKVAKEERDFIKDCMDKLRPYCRYKHLDHDEAVQALQRDEWRLELMNRAQNYLITTGTIAHDHYATMRMHPDFETHLNPFIQNVRTLLNQPGGIEKVLALPDAKAAVNVMEVLQLNYEERGSVPLLPKPSVTPNYGRSHG